MTNQHPRLFACLVVLSMLTLSLGAQTIGIGEWRTHLPYGKVISVAVADELIYAATPYEMFTYNTIDNRMERFGKIKGLSDVGISKIAFDKTLGILLIAYTNTNIDLIRKDGSIINISDIKDKDILGNKTINNILFINEYAYLSCGFGIVVVDIKKEEIYDTYYIGPEGGALNILDMTINDTSFFAASESGIYYADRNSLNLADYNQWHKDGRLIYPHLKYNLVEYFDGRLFINYFSGAYKQDTMFVWDGSSWDYFSKLNTNQHFQMKVVDNYFLLVNRSSVDVYTEGMVLDYTIWKPGEKSTTPNAADRDEAGNVWVGDNFIGLIKTANNGWTGEFIKPNGPGSTNVFALDAGGPNVWVASGGRESDWSKLYIRDGVFSFIDDSWSTHNKSNETAFDTVSDMVCVKVDPSDPNIAYVGTWQGGLFKFVDNALETVFTDNNSSLQRRVANKKQILISGLDFDDVNNLWVANTSAPDLLSVMKTNGEWRSFNLGGSYTGIDIGDLMVDKFNQKWMLMRSAGFILVFSDNNTIDNPSDDVSRVLNGSANHGAIPGSKVYSLASDMDGEVWIGSDEGISVIYSPENIFKSGASFDAQQILVPRNDGSGLADILLETEIVTCITVDGNNQKWIGTERTGVFLLSQDGLVEIHHFTTENSPLLSNNITGITINDDGEVFFGTSNGIISFRGSATPEPEPGSRIYAYPNPVREDYTGLIAIKNVAVNASVKITDSYGNLVYETRSEGGQAIWDGNNFSGRQAVSGVYLVFVSNKDGSETMVTKILVIR